MSAAAHAPLRAAPHQALPAQLLLARTCPNHPTTPSSPPDCSPILQRVAGRTLRVAEAQCTQVFPQVVPHQDPAFQQGRQLTAHLAERCAALPQRRVVPALVLPSGASELALCIV